MKSIVNTANVRAIIYHSVAVITVVICVLVYFGELSEHFSYVAGITLFFVDYIAQLFDPHPHNQGFLYKKLVSSVVSVKKVCVKCCNIKK